MVAKSIVKHGWHTFGTAVVLWFFLQMCGFNGVAIVLGNSSWIVMQLLAGLLLALVYYMVSRTRFRLDRYGYLSFLVICIVFIVLIVQSGIYAGYLFMLPSIGFALFGGFLACCGLLRLMVWLMKKR